MDNFFVNFRGKLFLQETVIETIGGSGQTYLELVVKNKFLSR